MLEEETNKTPHGAVVTTSDAQSDDAPTQDGRVAGEKDLSSEVPWTMKFIAVCLITTIGFGSRWSSGVTGAMKTTLKKELNINNTKYATLDGSKDFMVTVLILVSGTVTDRIGGAGAMLYGNGIYSVGAILMAAAAQVRSYKFMIFATIVQSLGDIATQVAQYKMFSSWFAPSNGFASTVGFELGIGKIGQFVGQSTANIIAENLGDFAWVYWMAVFMNLFTNVATYVFYLFNKWAEKRYGNHTDPATGEKLTEKNKKFEFRKMLELPWPFWLVILFSLFETSTAIIFSANATELAQQRFSISAVTAGWYSAMSQYMGFFLVPILGLFIDVLGHRLSVMLVCGIGIFIAMCLAAWGPTVTGTAASFGVYAFALSLGPTTIIDSIRTSMWYHEVFGSAYAIKIGVNNAMNIIVGIVTGVIQDADDNSYDRVVIVYAFLAACSSIVAVCNLVLSAFKPELGRLQWSRKARVQKGEVINELKEKFQKDERGGRNRRTSLICFGAMVLLTLGAWAAYFWGVATDHNY